MNHAAVPTNSFAATLPKALVTKDFNKIGVCCSRMKEERKMVFLCQAQLRPYCVFASNINIDEPSEKLTEVLPLNLWVCKVRSIVVLAP